MNERAGKCRAETTSNVFNEFRTNKLFGIELNIIILLSSYPSPIPLTFITRIF